MPSRRGGRVPPPPPPGGWTLRFDGNASAGGWEQLASQFPGFYELDLFEGDGMCMGYHGWLEDDYGTTPVVTRS